MVNNKQSVDYQSVRSSENTDEILQKLSFVSRPILSFLYEINNTGIAASLDCFLKFEDLDITEKYLRIQADRDHPHIEGENPENNPITLSKNSKLNRLAGIAYMLDQVGNKSTRKPSLKNGENSAFVTLDIGSILEEANEQQIDYKNYRIIVDPSFSEKSRLIL